MLRRVLAFILCFCVICGLNFGGENSMVEVISADEGSNNDSEFVEGKVWVDGRIIDANGAVFFEEKFQWYSIRAFFEAIGAKVEYEEPGNIYIHMPSQEILLCVLYPADEYRKTDVLGIKKTKNLPQIQNGALRDAIQLNSMGGSSAYCKINDRIYMPTGSFEMLIWALGYTWFVDEQEKAAYIRGTTLVDFRDVEIGKVMPDSISRTGALGADINDKSYGMFPLSGGSFLGFLSDDKDQSYIIKEIIFIDPAGRVYQQVERK